MSEKQKQILDIFGKLIPQLTDFEKEKLLAFGEGLGFAVKQRDQTELVSHRERQEI